ncbi:MAG: hypothetical protein WBH40_01665 [Ignavibacteriaceae bacterium]
MKIIYISFCFLLVLTQSLFAQVRIADFMIHDRANLWETMKDDGTIGPANPTDRFETYPSMDWPGGPDKMAKDNQRSYSFASGFWLGGKRGDGSTFLIENGPFTFVDMGTFNDLIKEENFAGSNNYNPNLPEQSIIAEWTNTENITVKRTSNVWSFNNLNNFIIIDYEITSNKSEPVTEVYVGFPSLIRPSYQDFVVHNGWGDDFNRTDELVDYDTTNGILYAYDDTPNFSLPNDVGNYWDFNELNEMRTPGYAGYKILYADETTDQQPQPATVFFAQLLNNQDQFSTFSNSQENVYNILSGEDQSLQADNTTRITPFMLLGIGPYNLAPGETIRVSVVEAVNGLPIEETIKGLEVQPDLPAGLDSLRNTIARSQILSDNNFQLTSVPPPSPDIDIIPIPKDQTITILWDPIDLTWTDPINDTTVISEYRIYRADRGFIGPYKFLKRIRPGRDIDRTRFFDEDLNKWIYEDQDISLGAGYYYTVTSKDEDDNESWYTNRNTEPVFAASGAAPDALNVKVFPNPFKGISGFPTSGAEDSIVWTNLPGQCTIRIYTSSGELVKTMGHDNPELGEEVWDQLSDSRQQVAPGIYFWTVQSDVGNAKGTLLIIK